MDCGYMYFNCFIDYGLSLPVYRNRKGQKYMTIKKGLRNFLRNDRKLEEVITRHAIEVSKWSYEFSLYMHFKINRTLFSGNRAEFLYHPDCDYKKFLSEFKQLTDWPISTHPAVIRKERLGLPTRRSKNIANYPLDPEYNRLRSEFELPLYDASYTDHMLDYVAESFYTNFRNNIVNHAYYRVKKFLELRFPKQKTYYTLDYLFHGKNEGKANDRGGARSATATE